MSARPRAVPPDVAELLAREHGVVHVSAAERAGVGESRLRRLVRSGLLVRPVPGCYAAAAAYRAVPSWERFRLLSRAFALSSGRATFLTGWSAAVTWKLPTMGPPPSRVTAVRAKAGPCSAQRRRHGDIRIVEIPLGQARLLDGIGLMSRGWAVAEIARTGPLAPALVVADAVARLGADLDDAVRAMAGWTGVHRARWVAGHADPLAESPVETLGRLACLQFDLPMPVSNAWVGVDEPEFRVDGLWPFHWAASEADGAVKYDNRPDASRIVTRQNDREWRLRRMGLDLARYGWELAWRRRGDLAGRFAALLRDNPPRDRPIRWWKHVPGTGPVAPEPADWPSPQPVGVVLPAGWDR